MKFTTKDLSLRGLILTLAMLPAMLMSSSLLADSLSQDDEEKKIREGMGKILKSGEIKSIVPSEISGLYEVMVGPQIFYVSADGKHLLSGKLFDIEKREDLTSPKIALAKAEYIDSVGEDNMVIFSPKDYKHTVTVFTDIDCGYCRKLHAEIEDYNELGIRVRYMMYPRAGVGSDSFKKAEAVFCADDRNEAMTLSKAGEDVDSKSCDNPVLSHFELGKLLGVTGTPAIFLESGDMLPGYIPAKKMSTILGKLDMEIAAQSKTQ
ncbi:MAG: DsbC family protein [Candidatus Thiodiazotropha sp. 6PLUC1]